MHIEIAFALAALALAVWEAPRARRGERHARAFFLFFLAGAVIFTAEVVHGRFAAGRG